MDLAWDQILSLVGAFLILLAYALESLKPGYLQPVTFQILNALGAFGLFITATLNSQYGFIVLEGAWVAVSLVTLARMALGKTKAVR